MSGGVVSGYNVNYAAGVYVISPKSLLRSGTPPKRSSFVCNSAHICLTDTDEETEQIIETKPTEFEEAFDI